MKLRPLTALSAAAIAFSSVIAIAGTQSREPIDPSTSSQQTGPAQPDDRDSTPTQQATRPDTLSNHLSHTQGVIKPPPTGDKGVVSPPSVGAQSTPVIPPPGSPGGNPDVEPK